MKFSFSINYFVICFSLILLFQNYNITNYNHHHHNTNSIQTNTPPSSTSTSTQYIYNYSIIKSNIENFINSRGTISDSGSNSGKYNNRININIYNNNSNNNNNNIKDNMSTKTTTNIKLLTYNVFIRPPGIRNNYDDYKDERIECLISDQLSPHILNKKSTSPQGIPNQIYSVDKISFPYIPYLSPWRTPRYNGGGKSSSKQSTTPTLKQQNIHNNIKDYSPISSKSILGQYDIICLQELFSAFSYRQKRFIEKAKSQGFIYSATSPSPPYFRSTYLVDGGLAVLSKYPIVESDYFLYEQGVDSDMLASKGVLYTKIKVSGGKNETDYENDDNFIHIFTTHMQASYAPKANGSTTGVAPEPPVESTVTGGGSNSKNDNIRLIQLHQLREFMIGKTYKDKSKIILAGDLNVNGRVSKDDPTDSDSYNQMLDLLSTTHKDLPNRNGFKVGRKVFSIVDLLKQDSNGNHPPTVGDTKLTSPTTEVPLETVLTNPNDYGCFKRLDYILIFNREFEVSDGVDADKIQTPPSTRNNNNGDDTTTTTEIKSNITPLKGSTIVDPFFIQGFPFTQLSDHYGVSTILQVNN